MAFGQSVAGYRAFVESLKRGRKFGSCPGNDNDRPPDVAAVAEPDSILRLRNAQRCRRGCVQAQMPPVHKPAAQNRPGATSFLICTFVLQASCQRSEPAGPHKPGGIIPTANQICPCEIQGV